MAADGLTSTVVERTHPLDEAGTGPGEFCSARRFWLGPVRGTDWLHEEVERRFGPAGVGWFAVESRRASTYAGASGEIAAVVLLLWGLGIQAALRKIGELGAEDLYAWVKQQAKDRGGEEPDFSVRERAELAEEMRGELAQLLDVPPKRLELERESRSESAALEAVYRDSGTGHRYGVTVGRNDATFSRTDAF